MKKMLRMVVALYLPMEENDTQELAEDRMLEYVVNAGMETYAWWNSEVVDVDVKEKTLANEFMEFVSDKVHEMAKKFRRDS